MEAVFETRALAFSLAWVVFVFFLGCMVYWRVRRRDDGGSR